VNVKTEERETDEGKGMWGAVVVVAGFILVGLVVLAALLNGDTAADVVTVVGSVTGVVGTVVGAFFGVKVGSEGKADLRKDANQARADAKNSEVKALHFASHMDPRVASDTLKELAEMGIR